MTFGKGVKSSLEDGKSKNEHLLKTVTEEMGESHETGALSKSKTTLKPKEIKSRDAAGMSTHSFLSMAAR